MNMNGKRIVLITTVTLLIFGSCLSVKPGTTKSGAGSLYETFFVGSDGTQYFINPLKFTGNNKDELLVDFTFRYKDQVKDSVTCNFSIVSDEKIKKLDEALLVAGEMSVKLEKITLLFNEKKGNQFVSRFSGRLLQADFNQLFNVGYFTVAIGQAVYKPSSQTQKSIKKLNDKLFVLFD